MCVNWLECAGLGLYRLEEAGIDWNGLKYGYIGLNMMKHAENCLKLLEMDKIG